MGSGGGWGCDEGAKRWEWVKVGGAIRVCKENLKGLDFNGGHGVAKRF